MNLTVMKVYVVSTSIFKHFFFGWDYKKSIFINNFSKSLTIQDFYEYEFN